MNSRKANWIWQVFFLTYLFTIVSNTAYFLSSHSPVQNYYKILMAFEPFCVIWLILSWLAVLTDVLAIIPFWGFIEGKTILTHEFWKWFYALRLGFMLTGHAYEFKTIQSLKYHDPGVMLSFIGIGICFYAPSYIATALYCFHPNVNKN